ncbi:hypothetical protein N7466_001583 [Penicillium verhagenii]|uniref:uncharacterized protein n=1 Tax=Penicillium verhagenii TaxID=1562060 RepID=UPI002545097C|nr:uncharacterized protein N7466_001583 [Penicillium verhagenii]KAJ5938449.1 hypothetical protein N7466_001583 [Penicillium verhagenii]
MPQSLLLWDAFAICDVPDKEDRTCCGLTKRGKPCKLFVTEEFHQMGVKKLNKLSRDPFDLRTLQDKLQNIVPHFLCARWHRQLQANDVRERWNAAAFRNQALVNTPEVPITEEEELLSEAHLHVEPTEPGASVSSDRPDSARPTSRSRGSSQFSGRRMAEALLREDGPPLNISASSPTVVVIEGEQGGETCLYLQSFRPTSSLGDETCGICLGVEQDDPLVLKCSECISHVHLGCMSSWLETLEPGSKSSCVLCKRDVLFHVYYDMPTVMALWDQQQRQISMADHLSLSTTVCDNQQPSVPIAPSVETPPTSAGAAPTTAGPSTHQVLQRPEDVDYPCLPTTSASSDPPSLRRSDRRRRAPDRYEP